jgi:hypothetical protein
MSEIASWLATITEMGQNKHATIWVKNVPKFEREKKSILRREAWVGLGCEWYVTWMRVELERKQPGMMVHEQGPGWVTISMFRG